MEKNKNIIIAFLIFLIVVLICVCVGVVKQIEQNKDNRPIQDDLLTEEKALVIGKELYEYAASVGHCKIFEYSNKQELNSIVTNYDEVASHFTDDYINNKKEFKKNVFDQIYKDEDGNYRSNGCGFGLAFTASEVIDFDLISIAENYIMFDVTINVKGYEPITSNLVIDDTTVYPFGIKKQNDSWVVDYYDFAYLTNLDIR